MVLRRCPGCSLFYDKAVGDCPDCGEPAPVFNKWLKTAAVNNQLFGQANSALAESAYAAANKLL